MWLQITEALPRPAEPGKFVSLKRRVWGGQPNICTEAWMTGPHSVLSFPTLSSLDFLSTLFTSWSQHSRCSSNCCCFVSDRKSGEVPGVKKVLSLEVDCLYLEGTASLGISTCIALPASIWHTPHPHPTSHPMTQVPLAREIGKWTILVFPPPE